jgi:hypothetical protein
VIGAERYTDAALREGRIIAKLTIPGGGTEGYKKYNLQPGLPTYWWVRIDESGTGGSSVFVTRTKDGKFDPKPPTYPLKRYVYGKYGERLARAIARWVWTLDDETTQGSCGGGSCR